MEKETAGSEGGESQSSGSDIDDFGGKCRRSGLDGKCCSHSSAVLSGLNLQLSSQLAHPLIHALNSYTGTERHRYALSLITNLKGYLAAVSGNGDAGRTAAGVAMDIGKTLLHDSENRSFEFSGEASNGGVKTKVNLDFAALGESFDIPAHCGEQAGLVEQRRVQQMRHRAQVPGQLFNQAQAF